MPIDPSAAELRQRALRLSMLSITLGFTPAHFLFARAGPDTWVGPTPSRCLDDLLLIRRLLERAAADLVDTVRLLERQAALVEAQTRATVGGP